jgi:hypothetical protein
MTLYCSQDSDLISKLGIGQIVKGNRISTYLILAFVILSWKAVAVGIDPTTLHSGTSISSGLSQMKAIQWEMLLHHQKQML